MQKIKFFEGRSNPIPSDPDMKVAMVINGLTPVRSGRTQCCSKSQNPTLQQQVCQVVEKLSGLNSPFPPKEAAAAATAQSTPLNATRFPLATITPGIHSPCRRGECHRHGR